VTSPVESSKAVTLAHVQSHYIPASFSLALTSLIPKLQGLLSALSLSVHHFLLLLASR